MITPVLADFIGKTMTNATSANETKRSMVDQTFQQMFDKIKDNTNTRVETKKSSGQSAKSSDFASGANNNNDDQRVTSKTANDSRDESAASTQKTASTSDDDKTVKQTKSDDSKTDKANQSGGDSEKASSSAVDQSKKTDDNAANKGDSSDEDTIKELASTIKEKVAKLKQSDPEAYANLIAGLGDMSMKDLLTTIGVSADEIASLSQNMDMNAKLSTELKSAIVSGSDSDIASALTNFASDTKAAGSLVATADVKQVVKEDSASAKGKDNTGKTDVAAKNSDSGAATTTTSATTAKDSQSASSVTDKVQQNVTATDDNTKTKQADGAQQTASTVKTSGDATSSANKTTAQTVNSSTVSTKADVKQSTATQPAQQQAQTAQQSATTSEASTTQQTTTAKSDGSVANVKAADGQNINNNMNASTSASGKSEMTPTQTKAADVSRSDFDRQLMNQVMDKARVTVMKNGDSTMTVRLDPPSLGQVEMKVEIHDNRVKAVLMADNHEAKTILENNIQNLKQSLHDNGLKVDEITVTTAGDFKFKNDSFAQNANGQNGGNGGNRNGGGFGNGAGSSMTDDAPENYMAKRYIHNGLLDVVA